MRKLTFGTPEKFVPTRFCKGLRLEETDFTPPEITFRQTPRGCLLEMPLAEDEHVYGLGLQLKGFDHRQTKKVLRVNADPMNNAGDTHAPVPFFVTTKGLGVYVDTARYAEFYLGYAKLGTVQAAPASSSPADSTQELYRKQDARETRTISIVIPAAQGVEQQGPRRDLPDGHLYVWRVNGYLGHVVPPHSKRAKPLPLQGFCPHIITSDRSGRLSARQCGSSAGQSEHIHHLACRLHSSGRLRHQPL